MEFIIDNRQDFMEISENIISNIKKVALICVEMEDYPTDCEVSLSFVTDEEIREINSQFRGIDRSTDVLSFPLYTEEDFDIEYEEISLGDIVISVETADRQAKEYGHSLNREICFLVCHSMFHLMGYDHMTEEEAAEMQERERTAMSRAEISRDEAYEKQ